MRYGLKSVRMDDIASQLGISKRTLYEMFGNREALIGACLQYNMECHERYEKQQKPEGNVIEKLLGMLENWESLIVDNINLMTQLRRYYPKLLNRIKAEHHKEGFEKLKQELRQGVEDGVLLPGINFDFSAQVLIEAVSNTMMNPAIYENSNVSSGDAFKYIMLYFFRGIATNKGRRQIDRVMAERFSGDIPGWGSPEETPEDAESAPAREEKSRERKIYSLLKRREKQD